MDAITVMDVAGAYLAMLATWIAYVLVEYRRGK